jgi:hypothetical protein
LTIDSAGFKVLRMRKALVAGLLGVTCIVCMPSPERGEIRGGVTYRQKLDHTYDGLRRTHIPSPAGDTAGLDRR